MNINKLYDSIINNAIESKLNYEQGLEQESFYRLDEILKTIQVLRDFKVKFDNLNLFEETKQSDLGLELGNNKNTYLNKELSFNNKMKNYSRENTDNNNNNNNNNGPKTTLDNTLTDQFINLIVNNNTNSTRVYKRNSILPMMQQRLDKLFFSYLQKVCNDKYIKDDKGELIHQLVRIKKKELRSDDYIPFKFRISPFSNGFMAEIREHGINEASLDYSKIKLYLWNQPYICRFNSEGRKSKTKGTHIWTIEAKHLPDGLWKFKKFQRKIVEPLPRVAYIGLKYVWYPKIWDPQIQKPRAAFSSPWLPDWLRWENNCLTGTPGLNDKSCEISAVAQYQQEDKTYSISVKFFLTVARLDGLEINSSTTNDEISMANCNHSLDVIFNNYFSVGNTMGQNLNNMDLSNSNDRDINENSLNLNPNENLFITEEF
ncbi:hypothetical protein K502DRAFT_362404 [Neoconidiobolus thromboides FSU 785]|nr:hypothetical protein K502DRAFT_362404 [Neoconidiobolus thromboides FSU 785]